ncbi:MAG: lytic transglycosylase domain-containing protein [Deltaproteobacteria bacterium]|nr:lytic transglycosylase domain-containing protein [Deltaproteobacteria bacterium]
MIFCNKSMLLKRISLATGLLVALGCLGGCSVSALSESTRSFSFSPASIFAWRTASVERVEERSDGDARGSRRNLPLIGDMHVVENAQVKRFTRHYASTGRRFTEQALARRRTYNKLLENIFDSYGLPTELVNVAFVESGYVNGARSGSGAVGMWQFTKATARKYGLMVNVFRDERKDFIKSTHAAARHFIYLYDLFDDWYLAIAAYNAGEGRVREAIKVAGTRDFFELAKTDLLRHETKEFVPKVLAATKISQSPRAYGFQLS